MSSLVIITGSMGAGKTAVLGEASDLLAQRNIIHAAIDLDSLGLAHLPAQRTNDSLMYANLRAVCRNYVDAGVQRFLLARAVENRDQLKLCCEAVGVEEVSVCRLVAGIETMKRRVECRDFGLLQQQYVERVETLNVLLDQAQLEDFKVTNESRRPSEVATEMLVKAGWIIAER